MTKPAYKNYDSYKDLSIEAVNRIPSHWLIGRIKEHGTVRARVGWKALTASEYVNEGYIFLSTPNIKNKEIDFDNVNYITKERYVESPEIMLKVGDILLAKDGSTLGTVNIVSHLPRESTVNGSIGVLRFKKQLFNKYVFYQIESEYIQHKIALKKIGMGVPHLFQQDIKNFVILIPPMPEQQAIADYLDAKTVQVDRKIELLEQKAAKYANLKQSLINETVTRGLDKTVAMKDSGVEWIGQIPAHWEVKRLKDIGTSIIGLTYSPDELVNANEPGGILVLRSSNIQNGRLSLLDTVYVKRSVQLKLILKKGDILICARNGSRALIGKNICVDDRMAGQTFGAFMTVYRSKYFEFLSKFFNSNMFESQSGLFMSSTVNQLTQNTLNNFLVPLPPLSEQKLIADYLEAKIAHIEKIIETIYLEIEKLTELRKTLINDVVTGKIKVYEG